MDLFDYLEWRGDLTFSDSPFCSVDALIFCQLSYLNFGGIVSEGFNSVISLNQAKSRFVTDNFEKRKNLGLLINPKTVDLFFKCAASPRFANLKLSGYRDTYSQKKEEQFAAITFTDESGFAFCAFRGTDDTIIGWKEDFNLAFMENLPAQTDAAAYLKEAASELNCSGLMCGGHSKGGNLALYAGAAFDNKAALSAVYNFDGPGFLKSILALPQYTEILKKTQSYFPQGSIVGMLFEHQDNYSVIKSDGFLVMQHDPFNWHTKSREFELCPELDKSSLFLNSVFNEWLVQMSAAKREAFVEVMFDALTATEAKTNSQLAENWLKSGTEFVKAFSRLDKETRASAMDAAGQFVKLLGHNIPELLK